MRYVNESMNVPASGTGTAIVAAPYVDKWVHLEGLAGGATFVVEGTIDGTNWVGLTVSLTSDGIYEVPQAADQLRLNRTVAGSGTITARLAGRVASP